MSKVITEICCTFKDEQRLKNGNFEIKWVKKNETQEINTNIFIFSLEIRDNWVNLLEILDTSQYRFIQIRTKEYE